MIDTLIRFALRGIDAARARVAPSDIHGCVVSETLEESEARIDNIDSDLVPVGVQDGRASLRLEDLVDLGFIVSRSYAMSQFASEILHNETVDLDEWQRDFIRQRDCAGRRILDRKVSIPTKDLELLMAEIQEIRTEPFQSATEVVNDGQPVAIWVAQQDDTLN